MQWIVIETEEFPAALGKLPDTTAVHDIVAELFIRLQTTAGQGERVGEYWIIKSNRGQKHPGIRLIYSLDPNDQKVFVHDVQLLSEPLRPPLSSPDIRP